MIDAAGTFHDIAISTLMAYFSVLSAYLLVAYLAGPGLTRLQTIVVTGLYLVMQLFMVGHVGLLLGEVVHFRSRRRGIASRCHGGGRSGLGGGKFRRTLKVFGSRCVPDFCNLNTRLDSSYS